MSKDHDLQPLLDVRQNQLALEFGAGDNIDTKSLALLAADVTLLLFMAQAKLHLRWWGYLFAVLPYLISILVGVWVSWPRDYKGAGVNVSDHPEYLSLESETLVLQLLADTQAAIETNKLLNALRLRLLFEAILCTVLATLVLSYILIV